MRTIDVCLVAGRRPELLQETLQSFSEGMLRHFTIGGVYVNIDPIFGDQGDLRDSVDVIRKYLPVAQINTPDAPGFCRAVKENWRRTTSQYLLHLEDDWILNTTLEPSFLDHFADASVMQVAFSSKEKGAGFGIGTITSQDRRSLTLLGKTIYHRTIPIFTTSPSIIRGEFARESVHLLDERLDPEKQYYNGLNAKLEKYAFKFRSLIYRLEDRYVVTDIGRVWRDRYGIGKVVKNGVSTWAQGTPTVSR